MEEKKKTNLYTNLTFFTKINSKQITELNERHKSIKHSENNLGKNLGDSGLSYKFWIQHPKYNL